MWRIFLRMFGSFLRGLALLANNYCRKCKVRGLKYLVGPRLHWFERFFWIVCCVLAWCAAIYLIHRSWDDFTSENSISFNTETEYLHWNTPFSAVSICESGSAFGWDDYPPSVVHWFNETFRDKNVSSYMRRIREVFKEIRYFDGTAFSVKKLCTHHHERRHINCPATDFHTIALKDRWNCTDLFFECQWNQKIFNCCKFFRPLPTEFGVCFSINSIHTTGPSKNLSSNVLTGPGRLRVQLDKNVLVVVHSPDDVPLLGGHMYYFNTNRKAFQRIGIAVHEVINDELVRSATLRQRQCRFPDENPLTLYDRYSFSGCIVECRMRAHLQKCNCTSPLMPRVEEHQVCDMEGLLCISSYQNGYYWRTLRNKAEQESAGLYCPCLLNCESTDVRTTYVGMWPNEVERSGFEIFLTHLASERCQRVVVRTLLELVVGVGTTLRLFMSVSMLSLVELVHFFVLPVARLLVARYCAGAQSRCCPAPPPPRRPHRRQRRPPPTPPTPPPTALPQDVAPSAPAAASPEASAPPRARSAPRALPPVAEDQRDFCRLLDKLDHQLIRSAPARIVVPPKNISHTTRY